MEYSLPVLADELLWMELMLMLQADEDGDTAADEASVVGVVRLEAVEMLVVADEMVDDDEQVDSVSIEEEVMVLELTAESCVSQW